MTLRLWLGLWVRDAWFATLNLEGFGFCGPEIPNFFPGNSRRLRQGPSHCRQVIPSSGHRGSPDRLWNQGGLGAEVEEP